MTNNHSFQFPANDAAPSESASRPERDIKTTFKSSNRSDLRPGVSGQDVVHHGMVDTGLTSSSPNRFVADGGGQVEGNLSDDLGCRLVALDRRPVDAVLARRNALGSGHDLSVVLSDDINAPTPTDSFDVLSVSRESVGYYQRLEGLDPSVAKRIDTYVPVMDAAHWAVIEEFVRSVVADAEPDRLLTAKKWMNAVAHFALWCWQTACLDLNREVVFQPDVVS